MDHMQRRSVAARAAAWALVAGTSPLLAQGLPDDPLQRRCWLDHTAERTVVDLREPTAVRFSNLRHGYIVRSPVWVEYGVRGMGVIPAGNPHDKAGHHHLLVDTPLPVAHRDKIPFSSTHVHFGKGQTGTSLELAPGPHTLRLLFADHDHRPYFVFSREITIHVAASRGGPAPVIDPARFAETCAAWYQDTVSTPRPAGKDVYAKNLRSGESVSSPFVLSLGVMGLGVAPAGSKAKDSGHFAYGVSTRAGVPVLRQELSDGRTEALVELPRGDYQVELQFLGNDGSVLLRSAPLQVNVVKQSL